ncbi:immunity 42 family protein [Herbaspirillum sp. WGmk3]|uniref:immunity 42 family protein n=1 Tax=Herbaspirillum sp. WGmk3 TaxID=2919925 RepID=UPI002091C5BD|nr:immunity 42 family protein [Herbaspirillum sp. WGmk3]MCO4859847.1 immunity 42 family protein [Herbaspirillum sp. WGmk3]
MEFGDSTRFSITIELDPQYGACWLFGRIAYWISGEMVGSYDIGTSLRDVLFQMEPILADSGRRISQRLFLLEKEKIFFLVESALERSNEAIYAYVPANVLPARFDVRIPVDTFDSWKIFLVDGEEEAKLMYRNIDSPYVKQIHLRSGEFDDVFAKAHAYLDQLYEAEVSRM